MPGHLSILSAPSTFISTHLLYNHTDLIGTFSGSDFTTLKSSVQFFFFSKMSDIFEGYERQYCELSTNITKKIANAVVIAGGIGTLATDVVFLVQKHASLYRELFDVPCSMWCFFFGEAARMSNLLSSALA